MHAKREEEDKVPSCAGKHAWSSPRINNEEGQFDKMGETDERYCRERPATAENQGTGRAQSLRNRTEVSGSNNPIKLTRSSPNRVMEQGLDGSGLSSGLAIQKPNSPQGVMIITSPEEGASTWLEQKGSSKSLTLVKKVVVGQHPKRGGPKWEEKRKIRGP